MPIRIDNLTAIQRALRSRMHPSDMGAEVIGKGAQKTAYKLTLSVRFYNPKTRITTTVQRAYVLKQATGGWQDPSRKAPPNLRAYGIETIEQWRAGDWIVQEYTTPVATYDYDRGNFKYLNDDVRNRWFAIRSVITGGDYHAGNFGIRDNGEIVCFDW